jgi:hypothetical protein
MTNSGRTIRKRLLIGTYPHDNLEIKQNKTNVKFHAYIDGVGSTFVMTKKEFKEWLV